MLQFQQTNLRLFNKIRTFCSHLCSLGCMVLMFLFAINNVIAQIDTTNLKNISIDTSEYIPGDNNFNLLVASSKGYGNEVIRFLEKGANINTQSGEGVTPLMYASAFGHLETVKVLLLNGANVNLIPSDGTTAIISSSVGGFPEISEELIIAGAKLNDRDNYGATPLLYASAYNHYQLCDMLLFYGADPNKSDFQLTTPLMAAVYAGNIGVAEMLLAEGAIVDKNDINGQTALMIASQNGDTAFVRFLLSNGAEPYSKSKTGYTAFYAAAANGSVPAMDILWKSDKNGVNDIYADPNPFYADQSSNKKEVQKWLKEHNLKPKFKPAISNVYLGGNLEFNSSDFFLGFRAGVVERITNTSVDFNYSFRPAQTRILYKEGDQDYYQFWEKRNKISLTLSKNIALTQSSFVLGGYVALSGIYSFGPEYRGTEIKADSYFKVTPILGFYGESKNLYYRLYYEYINSGQLESSPHWIIFGVYYKIKIRKKTYSNKEIQWF